MDFNDGSRRLFAYPVQIVRTDDGAIVRRGTVRLHVRGLMAADVLTNVIQIAARPNGGSRAEIIARFDSDLSKVIDELIGTLLARRILVLEDQDGAVPCPLFKSEEREDVFFWTFGADRLEIKRELLTKRLAIIGVNSISHAMAVAFRELAFDGVAIIDHPLLRSIRYYSDDGVLDRQLWSQQPPVSYQTWANAGDLPDCLITSSDFGGLALIREWNEFCVKSGIVFYPVVLQDMIGYAGPLVLPGRTACFECFLRRQASNMEDGTSGRETDLVAFHGQVVDGFLPPLAVVLANVAAFELFRYFSKSIPGFRSNIVNEIDLLNGTMTPRKLLRVPRCPVCGSGTKHAKIAIEQVTNAPYDPSIV